MYQVSFYTDLSAFDTEEYHITKYIIKLSDKRDQKHQSIGLGNKVLLNYVSSLKYSKKYFSKEV